MDIAEYLGVDINTPEGRHAGMAQLKEMERFLDLLRQMILAVELGRTEEADRIMAIARQYAA